MDKMRRHAQALQALRRKYKEHEMAKIWAITISNLSEKVANKTLVRSGQVKSLYKTETVKKQQFKNQSQRCNQTSESRNTIGQSHLKTADKTENVSVQLSLLKNRIISKKIIKTTEQKKNETKEIIKKKEIKSDNIKKIVAKSIVDSEKKMLFRLLLQKAKKI